MFLKGLEVIDQFIGVLKNELNVDHQKINLRAE